MVVRLSVATSGGCGCLDEVRVVKCVAETGCCDSWEKAGVEV